MCFEPISDTMCDISFKGCFRNVTLILAYASTADIQEENKHAFYNQSHTECSKIPKYDILVILGDFNTQTGIESFTLQTGHIILCSLLLNVADRSHNIMILGHVMLQHTIPCSGTTQMHNCCVTDLLNVCLVISNMTSLFSYPTPKENAFACLQAVCSRQ
jgi:hypothetical protein